MQPELLLVEHTPVSKVVLAWDFYRYSGQIYRYPQSSTAILRTSTATSQNSSQGSASPTFLPNSDGFY
ncbi:hypothetical protein Golob_027476 [Gossypium lobatum]|uniref:Uncharacterized protein n=1 Tax=Gossypium lobatum TaxID=34289 RepID=A0A7J8NIZ9_9ROSI|nr:hypothetical protein [Gossypium lobatum]